MAAEGMFSPLGPDEASRSLGSDRGSGKTPIVPVPTDAPPMRFRHPRHGEPSRVWPYHDEEGRLVGYVARWDFRDLDGGPAKEVLPVTFCELGGGRRAWRSKGMPAPRPLLALPEILARPEAPILICEGEKTRDAADALFSDMVATTPAHGAKSPQLTNFGPCAGRTVVIATDHDEPGRTDKAGRPLHPGRDFGDAVCALARAAGAAAVLHLHPERLADWRWQDGTRALRGEPIPDGWDLADAVDEGWTTDMLAPLLSDPAFLPPYRDAEQRKATRSLLGGDEAEDDGEAERGWPFRLTDSGVEKRIDHVDKESGAVTSEWRWFCSRLEVDAETRSAEGEEWGRLLRITDRDRQAKEWAMPMSMLAGDGVGYRERLLSLGLVMAPGRFAREALHEYISTARPESKALCVGRVGWHGGAFILSRDTIEPAHG